MKPQIKQREEKTNRVKIIYYSYCPICNQEIKGTKPSQVTYNLKLHMEKCKKVKRNAKKKGI